MSKVVTTKYPYVVKVKGICGGDPIVKGTRIPVSIIFQHYEMGKDIDEIYKDFPSLSLARISDALSYCFDHIEETRNNIRERSEEVWKRELSKASSVRFL
jgi:uncharacterized protein (DUF433 family)